MSNRHATLLRPPKPAFDPRVLTAVELPDAVFERFAQLITRELGIKMHKTKRTTVQNRLQRRLQELGLRSFEEYEKHLVAHIGTERHQFYDAVTTNKTDFFREPAHFEYLRNNVLPELGNGPGNLKVWSAACSTGEEPYSIALRLLEEWDQIDHVDVEIHGADIDSDVLERARRAVYGDRSLQRMPKPWLAKYFTRVGAGRYQLDDGIRGAITLHHVNVCDTQAMRAFYDFDVIFCRNVLIYFDEVSSRRAAENLYGALRPGGYLFLGHSESMSRISPIFNPIHLPEGFVYQRPTGAK